MIRDFRTSDTIAVQELIYKTVDECYRDVYPPRALEFFKDFHSPDRIAERGEKGQTVILEIDGRMIGTGTLLGNAVLGVFVHPEYQGRGYGRDIMGELEARALALGRTRLELSVSLTSKEFYEFLGYRMLEKRHIDVGEGQTLAYWHAEKSLRKKLLGAENNLRRADRG